MGLEWGLCDLTGRVLSMARALPGSSVTLRHHALPTANLSLSYEDEAAREAYPLSRALKVWLDGLVIFAGPIIKPRFSMRARRVEGAAIGPAYRLQMAYVNNRDDTNFDTGAGVFPTQTQIDQSEIMARLMEHASPTPAEVAAGVPGHGIIRGSLPASVLRDRTYETGKNILVGVNGMSEVEGGPDYDFTPLDRTDGVFAKLDTFLPNRGRDLSTTVIFESGTGTDNAAEIVWEPGGEEVVNRHTVIGQSIEGQPPNYYRANQTDSRALFGILQAFNARTDVVYTSTLRGIAREAVAATAFPPDFFEITPALDDGSAIVRDPATGQVVRTDQRYGISPRFGPGPGHDYFMGDTIGVVAIDRPTVEVETAGRVYEATLTETEHDAVLTEIKTTPRVSLVSVV